MVQRNRANILAKSLSGMLLICVISVFWWGTEPNAKSRANYDKATSELLTLCGHDELLASRLECRLYPAISIGRQYHRAGLETLDLFGEEAIFLAEKQPDDFRELTQITQLDDELFALTNGRWRQAVLQWATAGNLSIYLKQLDALDAEDRRILIDLPEALPLLIGKSPIANRMLKKYGMEAWHLFQSIDMRDSESVERVASALREIGEPMLRVNRTYGPSISWIFVPSKRDSQATVPRLFGEAISTMGEDAASALFLSNFTDMQQLLFDEKRDADEIRSALAFLSAHDNPDVRDWAADSPYTIRLLLETFNGLPIGQDVFARLGPPVATLLYQPGGYGANPNNEPLSTNKDTEIERLATLLTLRDLGWQSFALLAEYQDNMQMRDLLRREELIRDRTSPFISKIFLQLSASNDVEGELAIIAKKTVDQLMRETYPPTTTEKIVDWVPGYAALKTGNAWLRGDYVSGMEATFAVIDGATIAFGGAKIMTQAVKTVAKKGTQQSVQNVGSQILKEALEEGSEGFAKRIFGRLPGGMTATLRILRSNGTKIDVTSMARSATAIGNKLGLRSWGTLDRRIIMRGDRKVIVDFANKQVIDDTGKLLGTEFAFNVLADVAPLLLERTVHGLQLAK